MSRENHHRNPRKVKKSKDNALIFVPGIMGSTLFLKGSIMDKSIWPPPIVTDGTDGYKFFLEHIDTPSVNIKVGEGEAGLFQTAYTGLISGLKNMGYRLISKSPQELKNFWILNYDWRLTNRIAGRNLMDLVSKIRQLKKFDRVDVICHSMGGYAVRYALKNGADIDRCIFIASPHHGAPKAFFIGHKDIPYPSSTANIFLDLLNWGASTSFDFPSSIRTDVLMKFRKFQSLYELFPDNHYLDSGFYVINADGSWIRTVKKTYEASKVGLELPVKTRIRRALRFKHELGNVFPGKNSRGLIIYSNGQQTPVEVKASHENDPYNLVFNDIISKKDAGDATVPTFSASNLQGVVGSVNIPEENHSSIPNSEKTLKEIKKFL